MNNVQLGYHASHEQFAPDEARLFTLPPQPLLLGAVVTPDTACWVAGWADGVITVYKPLEKQREFIRAFREGGESKPMFLQAQTSYASSWTALIAKLIQT